MLGYQPSKLLISSNVAWFTVKAPHGLPSTVGVPGVQHMISSPPGQDEPDEVPEQLLLVWQKPDLPFAVHVP